MPDLRHGQSDLRPAEPSPYSLLSWKNSRVRRYHEPHLDRMQLVLQQVSLHGREETHVQGLVRQCYPDLRVASSLLPAAEVRQQAATKLLVGLRSQVGSRCCCR